MLSTLLTELLKSTMEMSPDAAKYTDLHFDVLSDDAVFAAQLYHRWYMLTVPLTTLNILNGLVHLSSQTKPSHHFRDN
jgi:hypothetical protein